MPPQTFATRIGLFFRGPQPASANAPSADEVVGFLRTAYPSVPLWSMASSSDDAEALCAFVRAHSLRALVIADAGPSDSAPSLREAAEAAGLPPWAVHVVEFGEAGFAAEEGDAFREHCKVLCAAQVERALAFEEVPLDSLKPLGLRLDAAVSRRDVFRSLARTRYEVVPRVLAPRCKGRHGCTLCLKACPLEAIAVPNGHAQIDKARCDGCGFCVKACPAGAIEYGTFAPGQIDAELRGLLHPAIHLAPRIVAFLCRGTTVPSVAGVLPLPLACVGMASPALIARAFDLGADGVALVQGGEGCGRRHDFARLAQEVRTCRATLEAFGIEPERIVLLPAADGPQVEPPEAAAVQAFGKRIEELGPSRLAGLKPLQPDEHRWQLGPLLAGIARKIRPIGPGPSPPLGPPLAGWVPLTDRGLPLGLLEVDADRCTLCGLCAPACPTEALSLRDDGGRVGLAFEHAACVACALCLRACPEKALSLRRGLDPSRLEDTAILLEEEMARCRRCGAAFAPLKMCRKIRDLLAKSGAPRPDYVVDLCPACRIAAGRPSAPQDPRGVEDPRTRNAPVLSFSSRESGE